MLYVIQMIDSGTYLPPRVFADQVRAQKAFVTLVREHHPAEFANYCAAHTADPESFATAQAYAGEGVGKEACFCYWELVLEDDGGAENHLQLPPQSRQSVLKSVADTQQHVLGVQAGLRGLAEKLTGMSQELIELQKKLGDDGNAVGSQEVSGAPEVPEPGSNVLDEKYQTEEWQEFVQSLIQMCGGNWGEFPLLSRHDWRQAVYGNETTLPYWEWVAITIDQAIERAKARGYGIVEDEEESGYFAYVTPAGERSSTLYEMEDLAWCAAGLHAAQENRQKT